MEHNVGNIPKWVQALEPVRKLPTNNGSRIRKCVMDALEKGPPTWARTRLESSISKEIYKANASGPTKRAVLSVLADASESVRQHSQKETRKKRDVCVPDLNSKVCNNTQSANAEQHDVVDFVDTLSKQSESISEKQIENIICELCGDKGYRNAIMYCYKCEASFVHRYCALPGPLIFEEDAMWACEDCVPLHPKQGASEKAPICVEAACETCETQNENRLEDQTGRNKLKQGKSLQSGKEKHKMKASEVHGDSGPLRK